MLNSLTITVESKQASALNVDMDETYTLIIGLDGKATLTAKQEWGILRGLETFVQLITWGGKDNGYIVQRAPLHIEDAPRFKWRGLMLDTSRHYQTPTGMYRYDHHPVPPFAFLLFPDHFLTHLLGHVNLACWT
eukprot:TRINITY_DN37_c0_g1_i2.p3 TRINITY_DN37_c0_g1~~TRINITY_DN37_c0_g1_i2.p3  ORF type:complete len:134 (+),score=25.99 TRINITY_DN37_c0_g1_i2:786-1187(+)